MRRLRAGPIVLCADDYALSDGLTRGILELAGKRHLSAISAIVTMPRWGEDAPLLRSVRDRVSIGLHLNLTLGRPLGALPRLAPAGTFSDIGTLVKAALRRTIDAREIQAETTRQLQAFVDRTGFLPDHIDGHQHAHVLPGVRGPFLQALSAFFPDRKPLVRDPSDRSLSIAMRGGETVKALGIALLAAGFGWAARRRGFPTNRSFSGFSAFDTSRMYEFELGAAMRQTGPRHILMCHPGYPDGELAALDPIVERRGQELAVIGSNPGLPDRIFHAARDVDGPMIDWDRELPDG